MPARISRLPPMTEKAFQAQVVKLAKLLGWKVFHPWLSVHSERGFPDLVLVRNGRMIFAELKRDGGKITTAQQEWLDELEDVAMRPAPGVIAVYVWFPSDLQSIAEILR